MQVSTKLLSKTAIMLLAVLLLQVLIIVVGNSDQSSALSTSQWETVRGYIDNF